MNQQKIGKFISEQRKLKNLTQVELADKLGVSNRTISKWENGNSMPDYSIFNDLCKELDISINELLSGEKLTTENYQKKLEENIVSTIDYNNKRRNKNIKKVIIVILLFSSLYLLYKGFIIIYFNTNSINSTSKEFPYNKHIYNLTIKKNNKANTLFDEKLPIYIPNDFKLVTDKTKSNLITDDCDVYLKNSTTKEIFDAALLICNNYEDNINNLDKYEIRNSLFPYLNINHLLEKYNIKDNLDLIKYYELHYADKYNIFTSSNKIKMKYIAKNYIQVSMPSYDKFYYLKNDLRGYLTKRKNNATAIIYMNNDTYDFISYSLSFYNNQENYFNDQNIIEIISSLIN